MMISESLLSNLNQMRRANEHQCLCALKSTLQATGEAVHMLAAVYRQGEEYVVTPFGMMIPATAENGLPTDPNEQLRMIQQALGDEEQQAWLQADSNGRPAVAFAELGTEPTIDQALLILSWDNPYELFSDPTAD